MFSTLKEFDISEKDIATLLYEASVFSELVLLFNTMAFTS